MAEIVTKKPPPPRPLKHSSLSGIQTPKGKKTSVSDRVRSESTPEDNTLEPLSTTPVLAAKDGTMFESSLSEPVLRDSTHTQTTTDQITDDALSVSLDSDHPPSLPDAGYKYTHAETLDDSVEERYGVLSGSDFKDKLMDAVEVILSVDDRLKTIEKRFNHSSIPEQRTETNVGSGEKVEANGECKQKAKDDTQKLPESQSCVPQIRMFDWYNFKNKWTGDKRYAIEVLKGPAKYYQERIKEQRQYEKSKKTGHTPVRSQPDTDPDLGSEQDIPERIRIVSLPLIAIMTEVDPLGPPLDLTPGVMLRPYRRLARLEDDLMKYLSNLEAKWSVAEKEDLERKTKNGSDIIMGKQSARELSEDGSVKLTSRPAPEPSPASKISPQARVNEPADGHVTPEDTLTDSIDALRDLRCLKQFFKIFIHPTVNRLRNRTARKIRFADLWYLFPHGEEVFVPASHKTQVGSTSARSVKPLTAYQSVYRVRDHSGGRADLSSPTDDDDSDETTSSPSPSSPPQMTFELLLYHIDWTTESYWPVTRAIYIKPFDNERDITSLEVYPTVYHENFEPIREHLIERGRKFLKLTKPTHMSYYGQTYMSHPCGPQPNFKFIMSRTQFVDSEVMVDFEQAPQGWRPEFSLLECPDLPRETHEEWDMIVHKDKEHGQVDNTFAELVLDDYNDAKWLRERAVKDDSFLRIWDDYRDYRSDEPIQSLEKLEDLILLPSRVVGYSYRDRTFNAFDIDRLQSVNQKTEGFDGLELPKGHQEMVEALVKEHFIKKEAYEKQGRSTPGMDIVSGKGKGLIILLHGAPGVGKTSTAECVAQSAGRPLFPITCGDLGLEPEKVEESLTAKFRLAAKWNCVMLIDEADIFLARRENRDLQRNALVSVFLRVLEYYEGILFLTTNRVGVFDDAFKSRIHVSLCYPRLTRPQTLKIWEKNLKRLKKIEDARAEITGKPRMRIHDAEILAYAKEHYKEHKHSRVGLWNGRQIRNAFQAAAALAYHNPGLEGPALMSSLFREVAKTTDEFDKYINTLYGEQNEEDRAYDNLERLDYSTNEAGKRNKHAYTTPQPVTPSHPRAKFANRPHNHLQDSGYASHGGMLEVSQQATYASSKTRVVRETADFPEDSHASPGASGRTPSPSVMARAARMQTIDQSQGYKEPEDSEDSEEDDD